ncbi:MAG: discoidin domain-containing protein, partial [Desulfuromonadales bacterium]|nr:discoidin domain-containing protein [Desulfuromonadales bacterium]
GSYALTAKAISSLSETVISAAVNVTVNVAGGARTNVASSANGGVATASSTMSNPVIALSSVNDGDRKGIKFWADNTLNVSPDWVQITFNGQKTIDEIDVFNIQDNYASPSEPTAGMTGTANVNTAYYIQYWNGTTWVTVSGGSITDNNKIWTTFKFSPVTTNKILVVVTGMSGVWSRIAEIEAYTP